MAAENMSSLRDITQCSICLDTFKEPKILPCIHTFCFRCLQSFCEDPNNRACPLCRSVFTVPSGGVQDLPTNWFMNQLMQLNQSQSACAVETSKTAECELCADNDIKTKASAYCMECDQRLCDRHSMIHKNKTNFKAHQMVGVKDMPCIQDRIKMASSYCENHPNEMIKLYCYDCKVVSCLMCYVKHHNKHECTDIKEAAEKFKDQLKEDVDKVETYVVQSRKELEQIELKKKSFLEMVDDTQNTISQKCDELIAFVQSHRTKLTEELNSFTNKQRKVIDSNKDEAERRCVILESFKRYCEEVLNKGTPCDISRAANYLHVRADELVQTTETSYVPNSIDTRFALALMSLEGIKNLIGELLFQDIPAKRDRLGEDVKASSFLNQPTLLHVLPINRAILGLAVLSDQLFVIPGVPRVDVYDKTSFVLTRQISIPHANCLVAIVACQQNNCLYVSDDVQKIIYRCDLPSNNVIKNWKVAGRCGGLSLMRSCNLLATIYDTKRIHEYTPAGGLIRAISLDVSIDGPSHCVQLSSNNRLVVCHAGVEQSRICIVDVNGRIINSYGGHPGSGAGQMLEPHHMAVDKHNNVMVADRYNNRVVLLSPTLIHLGDIPGQYRPDNIYLDELNRRLYIAEGDWPDGRLFVLHSA